MFKVMDFLSNLDAPQYINFASEILKNDSSTDMESSLSSVKDETSVVYMESSAYSEEDYPVNKCPENISIPAPAKSKKKDAKKFPTHLAKSTKRKHEEEYVPLAEQVAAFQKTPPRFHSGMSKDYEPAKHWSPHLVHPKSPNLQAAKRQRRIDAISREEQEAKEVEEMQRYKFRARPIRYDVLHNPQLPKVNKKKPTKPKDLPLRTAQRAAELNARRKVEEEKFEFHARPVPKAILQGPTGLKEKPTIPKTEPKTPNFALKNREKKWKSENKLNEAAVEPKFKAQPAPAPVCSFEVKHELKKTEIQPFSFDVKDQVRMAKKEKKIADTIEKENRVYVFKAQPMPSSTPSALPAIPKRPVTHPEPFSFLSEERSFKNSLSFTEQPCPTFKAQPATVLEKPPFIPEKPPKQPIEIQEFHLHTDVRAVERQKLKEINDIKEREKELALQRLKELEEEEERKEILRIRKEAVHKAQPIRQYKPVEIKPSNYKPTEPVSPKFHTDERLQARHHV